MIKKIIAASIVLVMLAAVMPAVSLADAGDIQPYNGPVGADSPLYSVKIFIQNVDIYITSNSTDKMTKEMNYADERLSEAEAAALANNTGALNASLDQYEGLLEQLNNTTQADDINNSTYANLSPMLYHHQQTFYAFMNNTTGSNGTNWTMEGRFLIVNGTITKMKNGMPFYYYNGTKYFMPPGQMKKNGGHAPQGPPGYLTPSPTITNGSKTWPWDQTNYTYSTKGHGNGKGNGNGNGNGKGNH